MQNPKQVVIYDFKPKGMTWIRKAFMKKESVKKRFNKRKQLLLWEKYAMVESINHVSFTVSDLKASVDFYENVIGLKCVSYAERGEEFSSSVTGIQGVKMEIAYMEAPGCSIELIQYVQGQGQRLDTMTCNVGSTHLCFNINEYDEWMERMKDNGVRMRGKQCIVPAGPNKGKRVCYVMDNDGNNLEFIEK